MNRGGRPTVFLDRDGTIIVDRHYLSDPAAVTLLPGAVEGLQRLRDMGFSLVLITNQSGVARGYFDLSAVDAVHARLQALLAEHGIHLDGIFVCPHAPADDCGCRKPARGLVSQACAALPVDLARSVVIGDKESDVALGPACGMHGILLRAGRQTPEKTIADGVVRDLTAAADWIDRQRILGGVQA